MVLGADTDFHRRDLSQLMNQLQASWKMILVSKYVNLYVSCLQCTSNLPMLTIYTKNCSALGSRQLIPDDC